MRVSFLVQDKVGTIAKITGAFAQAGIDIITFGTFMGSDPSNRILTIKVQGASMQRVVEIMKPLVSEILDVREV